MIKVSILAQNDLVLFDLAVPFEILGRARKADGSRCYDVSIFMNGTNVKGAGFGLANLKGVNALKGADMIVIPGAESLSTLLPAATITALQKAHARGARIISICSGALLLAQTGLLDGKKATTHWLAVSELKKQHPKIDVNPDVLFVEHGNLFTSAGACAGIDLCLHLIRKDFGAAVAARSARMAVTPLERSGGQAQFIEHKIPEASDSLQGTLSWMKANLRADMKVQKLAKKSAMSVRTFNRQFLKQVGVSPKRWLTDVRIERARELLETSHRSIEQIADLTGFSSAATFREQFRKMVTVTPAVYRDSFRG